MAAYAATVTLDWPRAERVGNSVLGLLCGSCNLTNYNTTHAALPAITGMFRTGGKLRVIAEVSSNGYVIKWDSVVGSFAAYRVDQIDDPLEEAPTDTAIGTFGFLVFGQI